ncbi:MAG: hypothetical protein U0Q12_21185 [Vicinamibacterales bacterium]
MPNQPAFLIRPREDAIGASQVAETLALTVGLGALAVALGSMWLLLTNPALIVTLAERSRLTVAVARQAAAYLTTWWSTLVQWLA